MKKIIIKCKNCKKKMRIMDKAAKYKCPYCGTVNKFGKIKKFINKLNRIGEDFVKTCLDLYKIIKGKITQIIKNIKK